MAKKRDFMKEAKDDARRMINHFSDDIIDQLRENGHASHDILNDYSGGDAYHFENHEDRAYTSHEAKQVLDQLKDYLEWDDSLWRGQPADRARQTQAAYTYACAVGHHWQQGIRSINHDAQHGPLRDMLGEDDPADPAVIRAYLQESIPD